MTTIYHRVQTLTTGSREKPDPPVTGKKNVKKQARKTRQENFCHSKLTWYRDRYKAQRQKNTRLSLKASVSMAARLSKAPMRHSSSMVVWVSKPSRGPSHSSVGEESIWSSRGFPV